MAINLPCVALKQFYVVENHTQKECAIHFNCCITTIERLIKKYRLKKTVKQKKALKIRSHQRKSSTIKYAIQKKLLIRYHLIENKSVAECARLFAVSKLTIQRRLREYGLLKSVAQQLACRQRSKTNSSSLISTYMTLSLQVLTAPILSPPILRSSFVVSTPEISQINDLLNFYFFRPHFSK